MAMRLEQARSRNGALGAVDLCRLRQAAIHAKPILGCLAVWMGDGVFGFAILIKFFFTKFQTFFDLNLRKKMSTFFY